ncbi:MAG: aldo/keto reductase [Clostridium sp.]|uniref:aldo/keto reductase n=1 Tax=Clostridium sp. TaxID=1506 RepID=UPI0030284201
MKNLQLKGTDLNISNISFGTGNFKSNIDKETAFNLMDYYVDLGGNFIDTANVYCRWLPDTTNCSEQYIFEWLKSRNAYNKVVIASKGGHPSLLDGSTRVTKSELTKELDESLMTLGLDCLDFYWFHRDNEALPIEEVVEIGEYFVKAGKIRYFGASNYKLHRMEAAVDYSKNTSGNGFSALSNQWSLAYPNDDKRLINDPTLVDVDAPYYQWLKKEQFPLIPFSSSSNGFFRKLETNTMKPAVSEAYTNDRNMEIYKTLTMLKEKYNTDMAALSLAPIMHQDFQVIPVTAFSSKSQMTEMLAAGDLEISLEDMKLINKFFL